jgi:hypothetical protein
MVAFAADENFNNDILRGLLRRKPDLDIVRVQDACRKFTGSRNGRYIPSAALFVLCNLAGSGEAAVDHSPKGSHCFGLAIKEVFEKTWLVQESGIGITLPVFTELADPVGRLMIVEYAEKVRGIEVWPTGVVENPKFIGLNTYHNVWLTESQIGITLVLPPQFDNHA